LKQDVSWLKKLTMPYFGDSYSRDEVQLALDGCDKILFVEDLGDSWQQRAAQDLQQKKIISLFNGRMEFGPRALGNRSIIANPTDPKVTERINAKVKRRPWYQPFCPSILEEERERLFQDSFSHKHMAIAFRLKPEFHDDLPCATHIDGTARPQFVSPPDNPAYWQLLKEFKILSGYGVLINTSFNLHGRTIVRTPEDAIQDFMDCGIDVLYIEGFRVTRQV
jgi:carbamoyltransferase